MEGAKRRQGDVHYRPAQRERRCGACVHFRVTSAGVECERVEGPISPAACCDLWRPLKHGARTMQGPGAASPAAGSEG
jgi:hypothetical protein